MRFGYGMILRSLRSDLAWRFIGAVFRLTFVVSHLLRGSSPDRILQIVSAISCLLPHPITLVIVQLHGSVSLGCYQFWMPMSILPLVISWMWTYFSLSPIPDLFGLDSSPLTGFAPVWFM